MRYYRLPYLPIAELSCTKQRAVGGVGLAAGVVVVAKVPAGAGPLALAKQRAVGAVDFAIETAVAVVGEFHQHFSAIGDIDTIEGGEAQVAIVSPAQGLDACAKSGIVSSG